MDSSATEASPLLGSTQARKPFYRARPLWLVPFAITAALVRGMTLAPRLEVFTQLSCLSQHHHTYGNSHSPLSQPIHSLYTSTDPNGPSFTPSITTRDGVVAIHTNTSDIEHSHDDDDNDDPRRIPTPKCVGNPAVQAGAARIQTVMTTTMGLLSALTSGYWGHFSERHGRTRVLALSTLGLFLTDLTFILVSTPGLPFATHGHKLLIIAPFIEGLLGGWSTLQSACSSYVSDCTSSGSRATIFSRFTGVFYLGLSVGPTLAGWIINNGIPGIDRIGTPTGQGKSVTEVFWLAICCSFVNFLLVVFVFPESLSREKRDAAAQQHRLSHRSKGKGRALETDALTPGQGSDTGATALPSRGFFAELLKPLSIFLPASITIVTPAGLRRQKDWSLTFLALTLFLYMLSTGVFQTKYLYAGHIYSWAADQLSYYISFAGGMRAVATLFLLPTVISLFKPKPLASTETPDPSTSNAVGKKGKPKLTKQQIRREIKFDILLSRCSLFLDIFANFLISVLPAPSGNVHPISTTTKHTKPVSFHQSEVLFVAATAFSSMSAGLVPAMQSLALCVLQARELLQAESDRTRQEVFGQVEEGSAEVSGSNETGQLFGALSTLQALGQMILAPVLFGLVYSETVASYPKAIFVVACGILIAAFWTTLLIRNPVRAEPVLRKKGKGKRRSIRLEAEARRGRSRSRKDLFGGIYGPEDEDSDDVAAAHRYQADSAA
ncbi:hypothetical protein PM082_015983 [Marasmius tenuissimus]|nr:hypothetical protein PM082_015983 [Marasmius tenuissimus]